MTGKPFDIAVVGTGPVGLAAALAFARAGWSTLLLGPEPARADGRTAAIMEGGWTLLDELGVGPELRETGGALRALAIIDDTGSLFRPPPVTFRASEIGREAFGWNIENARLTATLAARAAAAPGLGWRRELVAGFEPGPDCARLILAGGETVQARLVVAADGRRSRLREAADIAVDEKAYPQAAFTTLVTHAADHEGISTEFHRRTGPFTLVPLPGRRSSLVWVTSPAHGKRLANADPADLAAGIEDASHRLLGEVVPDGPRGLVPLSSVLARSLVGPRLALAGEAAHALPPIGAQGLNLGFADVQALLSAIGDPQLAAARDPGRDETLTAYQRARQADLRVRAASVDALNRALLSDWLPVDAIRGIGLGALGRVGPLRRAVMRAGLGAGPGPDRAGLRRRTVSA